MINREELCLLIHKIYDRYYLASINIIRDVPGTAYHGGRIVEDRIDGAEGWPPRPIVEARDYLERLFDDQSL